MWSPVGQQVMIPTPGQTNKRFGIGAVNYHTGETVVDSAQTQTTRANR